MKFKPFEELFKIPIRNGLTKPKKVRGEGYKMINMGELFEFARIQNINMDRVPLNDKEKANAMVENGDLLFARQSLVRDGAGQCSIFLGDNEEVCFESHLIRCRLKPECANPLFYFYYFSSKLGKQAIDSIVEQGAGAAGIRGSDLAKVLVPDVEKIYQDKVAEILNRFDKKIEINIQINQTLEKIAQLIFKNWFVDFEPVKVKVAILNAGGSIKEAERAAICAIAGIDEILLTQIQLQKPNTYATLVKVASLFPSAMQNSELGEIPLGWCIKPLDKIANYQNGLALQKFRPENENEYLPVLKISQLKKGIADGKEKASPNIKSEYIVDNGDVIFSWSGSLTVDIWCGGRVALNQHLFKVTSDEYPKWLYTYYTKHHLEEFQRIAASKAVTMGHIKREHLSQANCVIPSDELILLGNKFIGYNLDKQIQQKVETNSLTQMREVLISELFIGEKNFDILSKNVRR